MNKLNKLNWSVNKLNVAERMFTFSMNCHAEYSFYVHIHTLITKLTSVCATIWLLLSQYRSRTRPIPRVATAACDSTSLFRLLSHGEWNKSRERSLISQARQALERGRIEEDGALAWSEGGDREGFPRNWTKIKTCGNSHKKWWLFGPINRYNVN